MIRNNRKPKYFEKSLSYRKTFHLDTQYHKMTAVVGSSEMQVRSNSDTTKLTSDPQCICCQHLQHELETVLLELQTAKEIIELLHAETNSSAPHTYANTQAGNA